MQYLGDYKEDETVYFLWSTNDADGASITRTVNGTVSVYKDNGVSQSVLGVTDTEDFDSLTGIHACTIDTSADAFYATGADYVVVLSAATIDGQTVNAVLAHFSIENRFMRGTDSAALATALATAQTDLDNPAQYKADVSALALEATLATHDTEVKAEIDANETKIDAVPTVEEIEAELATEHGEGSWEGETAIEFEED